MTAHPFSATSDLRERLQDPDPEVRRVAVMELPYSDDDDYIELSIAALGDADAGVRADAAKALEGVEEAGVVSALVPMLKDQDAHVRQAVADTLAELKESCWGSLLLPMVTDSSTEVQTAALRALRALRVPESFALAMSAAQSAEAAVRREAAGVLAYLKNDAALGTLTRLAIEDPSTEVRRVAVGGLGFSNNVD
ncbi:MAG: HEAT repeat domain-containing protein, partial [Burkholderiales bacterium]